MIDYYLHKKCPLTKPAGRQLEDNRCGACVWLIKDLHKCVFAEFLPVSITLKDFESRAKSVNEKQQVKLSEPFRRFVLK